MFGGAWHQGRRCRGIRDRVDECHRSGRCWWHTGGIPKAKGEGIGWCMGLLNQRLRDRLAPLRDERHVNVSAWARDVIAAALDREFPADLEAHRRDNPSPAGDPASSTTAGGAVLDGPDVAALAEDPRGTPISITDRRGGSWNGHDHRGRLPQPAAHRRPRLQPAVVANTVCQDGSMTSRGGRSVRRPDRGTTIIVYRLRFRSPLGVAGNVNGNALRFRHAFPVRLRPVSIGGNAGNALGAERFGTGALGNDN